MGSYISSLGNWASFTNDKKFAYVAAIRNDSYGDYDIYKINFEEIGRKTN